jgi:AAA domain
MKLTLEEFAQAKGFTVGELAPYGVRATKTGSIIIPYRDANGNEYIRHRIRNSTDEGKGFAWNKGDAPLLPYGVWRPIPYAKGFVWIVEGESDCWALWSREIPALGLPGAQNIACLDVKYLEGITTVAVIQEPGEAGERFPHRVAQQLYDHGFGGKVYAVTLPEKDPRALLMSANGTFRDELSKAFQGRRLLEPPRSTVAITRSVSMADVFDTPIEETTWLIDGLLPEGGIGLVAAPPKAGKSVFGRNAAIAVARGGRFIGRKCAPGTVLWCAFEERQEDVVSDFKLMGADRTDPIRFHFGSSPADAIAWLNAECDAHKVGLVVLDTWHKFALIENINQYAEVSRANEPLMKLARERGVAQLWLHHTNKGQQTDGSQVLGSQALFAACDSLMFLTRAADGTRTLRTIQRRGDDLEPTVLEMDDERRLSSAGSKFTMDVARAEQRILDALGTETLDRKALARGSSVRRTVFWSALANLIASGLVERSGTGKPISPFFYRACGSHSTGPLKGTTGTTLLSSSQTTGTTSEQPEPREPAELDCEGWTVQVGEAEEADDLLRYADKRMNEI